MGAVPPQQLPGYPTQYPAYQAGPMQPQQLPGYPGAPQQMAPKGVQQPAAPTNQPLQNTPEIINSAQILRKAMKGLGTDEMAIIEVVRTHNWQQRAAIAESFCSQYGMTLDKELHKELSGNLRRVLKGAFTDRYVYWAQHIDEAIRGAGTDEKRLIQLVIMMSDQDNKLVN